MLTPTGWLTATAGAVCVCVTAPTAAADVSRVLAGDFADACVGALSLGLLVLSAWIVVVLGVAAAVPASHAVLRKITPAGIGAACFAVGACVPAAGQPAQYTLDGLQSPDRPVGAVLHEPRQQVVVAPGDCLWTIAARHLPPKSDASTIAASVVRWHHHNRSVIGSRPDLIFPGQRLTPPPGKESP